MTETEFLVAKNHAAGGDVMIDGIVNQGVVRVGFVFTSVARRPSDTDRAVCVSVREILAYESSIAELPTGMSGRLVARGSGLDQIERGDLLMHAFSRESFDSSWLSSTVRTLAQAIQNGKAFDRLSILADALEEAGCTNSHILAHCRGPASHVRGCWVVDLLLGKE